MRLRLDRLLTLPLALAVLACGDAPEASSPVDRTTVRDSVGIRIVENDVDGVAIRSVSTEPVLSIGSLEGGDDALFRVRGIGRLSDGSWIVSNTGTMELRRYGSEGDLLNTIGRDGEGPGEFRSLSSSRVLAGDTILVGDIQARRESLFLADGTFVRSFTPELVDGQAGGLVAGRLGGGRFAFAGFSSFGREFQNESLVRPSTVNSTLAPDGSDAQSLGSLPGSEAWFQEGEGFVSIREVPFSKESAFTVLGDRLVTGVTEDAEVRLSDESGALTAIWRFGGPAPEVTSADWELARSLELDPIEDAAYRQTVQDFYSAVTAPERMPAWSRLLPAIDGTLWIRAFDPPGNDDSNRWWRLDSDGRLLDAVELPTGLELYWASADEVAGIEQDELDIEYLRVYRIGG